MASHTLYCSAKDVRTAMGQTSKDDDTKITGLIAASSRMIDGYCGRKNTGFQAIQTASARIYSGTGHRYLYIDECVQITALAVKAALTDATYDTSLAATEYAVFRGSYQQPNFNDAPYHGVLLTANSTISKFLRGNSNYTNYFDSQDYSPKDVDTPTVQVTARWGYADSIPDPIKQATIMQSIRLYHRQEGSMADALLQGDFGEMKFLAMMDKDVKVLLTFSGLIRPKFVGN